MDEAKNKDLEKESKTGRSESRNHQSQISKVNCIQDIHQLKKKHKINL